MKLSQPRFTPALALRRRAVFHTCTHAAPENKERPNIVVILIDDMGFSDLDCYGGEVPTPNINKLAGEGVRFTQFYNTARCSPSRAALLTGLYPHQAGMGFLDNMVVPGSKGTQGRLRDDCVTMAEVLGDAGYFTFMTGKWHLGQMHGTPPWKRGFQRSLNAPVGELYFPNQQQRRQDGINLNGERHELDDPMFGKDWYGPDLITEWGLKFIDEAIAEKKPFFHYLPHCATHFPLQVPKEDIARYRGKYMVGWDKLREERHKRQIEMGLVDPKWPLTPLPPDVPEWDTLSDERQRPLRPHHGDLRRHDRPPRQERRHAGRRPQEARRARQHGIMFMCDNGGNAEAGPRGRLEGDDPGGPKSTVFLGHELGHARQHAVLALQALHARRRHLHAADRPLARRHRERSRTASSSRSPATWSTSCRPSSN